MKEKISSHALELLQFSRKIVSSVFHPLRDVKIVFERSVKVETL